MARTRERPSWLSRQRGGYPPDTDFQCYWCGKVRHGPRKGMHDRLLAGNATATYCPGCYVEQEESYRRDHERRILQKEGHPETVWPPRLLSRLEQRTGDPQGSHEMEAAREARRQRQSEQSPEQSGESSVEDELL